MNESFIQLEILGADGRESRVVLAAGGAIKIGSGADCDVVIAHPDVAPCQARLLFDQEVVILEPAGAADARSAVRLDGEPITAKIAVRARQKMAVGPALLAWRWLPKEEWPTMPAKLTGSDHSAVVQLADELKKGRYRAGSEVGRGGMGRILQAEETPLRRPVAMKVLLTSEKGQRHAEERFIREARVTGGLQHPSIVPVHELNVDETGRVFYTMKLVKGLTLREILHRLSKGEPEIRQSYRLSSLLTIFQKVCDAVAFAHAQPNPIIHRDLKPDNIMVGEYGEVLVMDWGLAKVLGRDDPADDAKQSTNCDQLDKDDQDLALLVTQPGTAMGTPGYMAPEQARGQADAADERTDIYALGAILYALLTLESPSKITAREAHDFQDRWQTGEELTQDFRSYVAPLLSKRSLRRKLDHLPGRTVPNSLAAVVLKAMALRPEHRFESVKKLQADVAAYQAGFATSAEEARAWRRLTLLIARNKILFTAIAAIFAVLLTATAVSLQQRRAAIKSNKSLQLTLQRASLADHEAARKRFRTGEWREGLALMGRALTFWPDNREAANYLLSAIAFGQGDRDKLPLFGVYHGGPIIEEAFSPDGKYFATASDDHTARIWSAVNGAPVGKPLGHAGPVMCIRFSPNGAKVVTADESGIARIWDPRTGEALVKPMQHGKPELTIVSNVESAVFSSDGRRVLTACHDHTARLWDADTGEEIAELVNPDRVGNAVFSPDETRILTSFWRGGAILWDAKTLKPIGTPLRHNKGSRRSMFTPNGAKIVTSSMDHTARIWDGYTAQPLCSTLDHPDQVWSLDISPNGKTFATACLDKKARLWSLKDATPEGIPMQHQGPVYTTAFSPDGKRLVTSSGDKTVRVWDAVTCKQIGNAMRHDEAVHKASFNSIQTRILSAGADGAAYVWDAATPAWPGELIPLPREVLLADFDKSDERLFVCTRDGTAGVWSLTKREFVTPIAVDDRSLSKAAFHRATNRFATTDALGVIRFWDAATATKLGETPSKAGLVAIEFAADGRSLFAAYLDEYIFQWKIPEGTAAAAMKFLSAFQREGLAAAPNGTEIAISRGDGLVQFYDISTGNALRKPITHSTRRSTSAVAISYNPDGRLVATGCEDHTVRIWSADSGEELGESIYANGRPTALRFSRGGNELLVASDEATEVNCYDTRTHNVLYSLPHPAGVNHITSNVSGSLVVTVTNDGVARLWRIPTTSDPPPKWLPEYIRAIGGLTFSTPQQLTQVPTRERLELRKGLLDRPSEDSIWDTIMRWSFIRTETDAPDPWSNAGR